MAAALISRITRQAPHGLSRALSRRAADALSHRAAVIEDILMAHPAIANVRAFAVDGDEAVHAVILPNPGALLMDGCAAVKAHQITEILCDDSVSDKCDCE